jgi:hypothetical protein
MNAPKTYNGHFLPALQVPHILVVRDLPICSFISRGSSGYSVPEFQR